MEEERKALLDEVKKVNNGNIVAEKMAKTFSQRRKEIIVDRPLVSTVKERWPGLFGESQVYIIPCVSKRKLYTVEMAAK